MRKEIKLMRHFMGNACMYPNCKSTACKICSYYKPTMFGKRVPRWLGNLGFKIENFLIRKGL